VVLSVIGMVYLAAVKTNSTLAYLTLVLLEMTFAPFNFKV